jgi:DNA-binding transcriptional ArsR family regulator
MPSSVRVVEWLRAAGEPTRLRLLALCAARDYSVGDLARTIGQSEPRVSRHLRILCDAGLVRRLRHGQWVHYSAAGSEAFPFVQGLLAQVDLEDNRLTRDREKVRSALTRAAMLPGHSRLGRALRAFVEADSAPVQAALVVGIEHLDLLACAAAMARSCVAVAAAQRGAQSARAFAEEQGFALRVVPACGSSLPSRERLGIPARGFDALILDRPAFANAPLPPLLAAARRLLAPQARLWLFERYEVLESAGDRVVEHPLARLRRLVQESGMQCLRLTPIEADGQHVLAVAATPRTAADQSDLKASA